MIYWDKVGCFEMAGFLADFVQTLTKNRPVLRLHSLQAIGGCVMPKTQKGTHYTRKRCGGCLPVIVSSHPADGGELATLPYTCPKLFRRRRKTDAASPISIVLLGFRSPPPPFCGSLKPAWNKRKWNKKRTQNGNPSRALCPGLSPVVLADCPAIRRA